MLVDKQSELMSDLLFTVHQHGGDDVTWKPPIQVGTMGHFFIRVSLNSGKVPDFFFQLRFHHTSKEAQKPFEVRRLAYAVFSRNLKTHQKQNEYRN